MSESKKPRHRPPLDGDSRGLPIAARVTAAQLETIKAADPMRAGSISRGLRAIVDGWNPSTKF